MKIFCIHGNFQTAEVWHPLAASLVREDLDLSVVTEDLYAARFDGFEDWTEDFCRRVESQTRGLKSILLGYSLGGRLALHACLRRPDLWQAVVLVGSDPGLGTEQEKQSQLLRDQAWAARLIEEPMDSLILEWDRQSVFCNLANSAPRHLEELNPQDLSRHLDIFSKGRQRNLVPELSQLKNLPILFLFGEKDEKYARLGKELAERCPCIRAIAIREAGHRVPWDNKIEFARILARFIEEIRP